MFVYAMSPIDYDWEYLPTVQDVASRYGQDDARLDIEGVEEYEPRKLGGFLKDFKRAKDAATDEGWEGDFRGKARVLYLPSETGFDHAFAWKQDNNGTTFIVSPQILPHLEKYC